MIAYPIDGRGKNGNCGVVAIAALAGRTVSEVHSHLAKNHRSNWKGSCTYDEIFGALKHYGVKLKSIYKHKQGYSQRQLGTIVRDNLRKGEVYVVLTTSHIQIVHRHEVWDQSGTAHYSEHWGRRKRVQEVFKCDI